jgi:poly-gamma-glutamate synthesis protein (capsule biosynthesis protein)
MAVEGAMIETTRGKEGSADRHETTITIAFGGDVMLGRLVNKVVHNRGPRYIWGNTLPLLLSADVTLVNLECVIAKGGTPFVPPRVFYFRADPQTAEALTIADIEFVSLANNHAMDFQAEALLETIEHLEQLGIAHAGAGRNQEVASMPASLKADGVKIGIVSFADHYNEYAAGEDTEGTNVIKISLEEGNFKRIKDAILAARADSTDLVIFSIHWGPNMRQIPTQDFVQFAHAVMDAGADVFYGHSAHIFQGIEIYKGKLIFYDTGDLIDDYYVDPVLRNDQQLLFIVKATRKGLQRVEMVPLLIDKMQVNLASGRNFNAIRERIKRLSQRYGTEIYQKGNRLIIDINPSNYIRK